MSGCGYQGYEFGARYMDSICVDGVLYDADDCDNDGCLFEPLVCYPCPLCNQLEAMHSYADDWLESLDNKWPRYSAWHLVMDIRRNRGAKSIPLLWFIVLRAWRELRSRDARFYVRRWFA